jgi:N-ethylmaleimide reductase
MSNQPLFMPYRMRARSHDHVPTPLQAKYYAQRALAGLIIAEATAISPEGFGWADTPGLWTEGQVRGRRRVTCGRRPHHCTALAHRCNLAS